MSAIGQIAATLALGGVLLFSGVSLTLLDRWSATRTLLLAWFVFAFLALADLAIAAWLAQ